MQARASEACLDVALSERSKEGCVKGSQKVFLADMEDMVFDEVLVLF